MGIDQQVCGRCFLLFVSVVFSVGIITESWRDSEFQALASSVVTAVGLFFFCFVLAWLLASITDCAG